MNERNKPFCEHYDMAMQGLTTTGLLLGSVDADGKPNIMTIGWGTMGSIWGMSMWIVLVRPSRHTYKCIEHSGCFTVNVPAASMAQACSICGTKSGRDVNKFELCGLGVQKSEVIASPGVQGCPVIYECQVVHRNDLDPHKLADEVINRAYKQGDYHRVYFGKVVNVRAEGV